MSVFNKCENCSEIAEAVCGCSSTPRFFCDLHATDHRRSGGTHPFKDALLHLSPQQTSLLRRAFNDYQKESIRKAIIRRNQTIENLLKQVRKAEEDCSREIESILKERSGIEEVCAFKSLPVSSNIPLFSSLVSLRASSAFSYQQVSQQLSSLRSFLPPLSFSSQSSSGPRWELFKQFKAHDEPIRSLAISDCERYLATGSEDTTIKIWDLQNLECINILLGHTFWVRSVVFWGDKLISGSEDDTIKIWEGNRCLQTLSLHSNVVMCVCVSSCKRLLASGGRDKIVFVYSLEQNRTLHSLLSHSDEVNTVVFSPSNKQIVSGGMDKSIKVWDTDTGELLKTLDGHSSAVICICFVESSLVSSSFDKSLKVWNLQTEKAVKTLHGHSSYVLRVEGNGNILVSLGQDDSSRVWDRRSGECIQTLEGHGDYSQILGWYAMGLKIIRGGDYIISAGRDKKIKIFRKIS